MANTERPIRYLGIDPGAKGGLALVGDGVSCADAWRYPGDLHVAVEKLRELDEQYQIALAAIERVQAMPRMNSKSGKAVSMGAQSSFKFGGNFYGWQWALAALKIPYTTVTPRTWQKEMLDAGTGETKARSLSMARRLFPGVDLRHKADDGKADALHLARYAMRYANIEK